MHETITKRSNVIDLNVERWKRCGVFIGSITPKTPYQPAFRPYSPPRKLTVAERFATIVARNGAEQSRNGGGEHGA
jgi:hypothetical protein